jgi:hypothetical protein
MKDSTWLAEELAEQIEQEEGGPSSLSEMEGRLKRILLWLGGAILHRWLQVQEGQYVPEKVRCECGEEATYRYRRQGKLYTVFGEVRYKRAYYVCPSCHRGVYPLDKKLGLRPNTMSAELERLAGIVGVEMPFGQGSAVFEELTLVSLSDHSLDKAAQSYGEEVMKMESEWQAEAQDMDQVLAHKRTVRPPGRLYGSLDGGRVHIRGEGNEADAWRELKVGAWYEARGRPPQTPNGEWTIRAEHITYYTDICDANTFREWVWTTGFHRHAQLARELVFLGDGSRWIWDIVSACFPHAIQIVDWFHACEYLALVAQIVFRSDEQRHIWVEHVKAALWDGRLDEVIAACQQHINPDREDDPAQKAVTYYTNNRHRMDYPTYRAQGYHIGSGTIESGIKQIGSQRMKVAGARWSLNGARKVAKARAAFLSGQWDDLAARRMLLSHAA